VDEPQAGTEATEIPDAPQAATEPQDEADVPDEADDEPAGKEAARYRRRLRDAEAERDELATRVEALQRAEVERLAGQKLTKPSAIWAAGVELSGLLDEAGNVSPDAVAEAAQAARDELGLAQVRRGVAPKEGLAAEPGRSGFGSMADVISGHARGWG